MAGCDRGWGPWPTMSVSDDAAGPGLRRSSLSGLVPSECGSTAAGQLPRRRLADLVLSLTSVAAESGTLPAAPCWLGPSSNLRRYPRLLRTRVTGVLAQRRDTFFRQGCDVHQNPPRDGLESAGHGASMPVLEPVVLAALAAGEPLPPSCRGCRGEFVGLPWSGRGGEPVIAGHRRDVVGLLFVLLPGLARVWLRAETTTGGRLRMRWPFDNRAQWRNSG